MQEYSDYFEFVVSFNIWNCSDTQVLKLCNKFTKTEFFESILSVQLLMLLPSINTQNIK